MSEYAKIKTARTIICDLCNELHSDEPCEPADCDWLRMLEEDAGDVVTVVRCGKCIHRDPEDKKCDCGCWHIPFTVKDEDFCSYGERKNDADEPDRA